MTNEELQKLKTLALPIINTIEESEWLGGDTITMSIERGQAIIKLLNHYKEQSSAFSKEVNVCEQKLARETKYHKEQRLRSQLNLIHETEQLTKRWKEDKWRFFLLGVCITSTIIWVFHSIF